MRKKNPTHKTLNRMDSQPLDEIVDGEYSIEKKNDKKWKGVVNHAIRNKTRFKMTASFVDVDNTVHEISVTPNEELLCSFYTNVDCDDDEQVIASNSFYYKIKHNTEQLIQYRKARGDQIRVSVHTQPLYCLYHKKSITLCFLTVCFMCL